MTQAAMKGAEKDMKTGMYQEVLLSILFRELLMEVCSGGMMCLLEMNTGLILPGDGLKRL